MIRMTKQTDYGFVLLTRLAAEPERVVNAPDLAAETRLPLPMVSKILKLLARRGLLRSHRGVKGGYALARRPAEIHAAEILRALEGPVALTVCIDGTPGRVRPRAFLHRARPLAAHQPGGRARRSPASPSPSSPSRPPGLRPVARWSAAARAPAPRARRADAER